MTNPHTPPTGRDPLTGALTDEPRHNDPTIDAFLADGDYADIDEWMEDSDYVNDGGEWYYPDDYADPEVAGHQIDAEGAIEGAIEASGFDPEA